METVIAYKFIVPIYFTEQKLYKSEMHIKLGNIDMKRSKRATFPRIQIEGSIKAELAIVVCFCRPHVISLKMADNFKISKRWARAKYMEAICSHPG